MFTAHMLSEKISEDLHAETKTPKESYENAIRRETGIEKIGPITQQSPITQGHTSFLSTAIIKN